MDSFLNAGNERFQLSTDEYRVKGSGTGLTSSSMVENCEKEIKGMIKKQKIRNLRIQMLFSNKSKYWSSFDLMRAISLFFLSV